MDTVELLQVNLHVAHDSFLETVKDLTQANADWNPQGRAHPIGERYAHAAAAEDWLVNGIARGGTPWFASDWAGKNGFGGYHLGMSAAEAQALRVDLVPLAEYTRAIFDSSRDYFNSLTAADMERMIDMSALGYGMVPFPAWASAFVIGHVHDIMGEISALKGIQGLKGYPF